MNELFTLVSCGDGNRYKGYNITAHRHTTRTHAHTHTLLLKHEFLDDLVTKGLRWRMRDTLLNHIAGEREVRREREGGRGREGKST